MYKIITNGRVYLSKNNFTEALLIKDGRIVKCGSNNELASDLPSNTERIDADGAYVLPAFYDSHLHLMWIGRRMGGIECSGANSIDEIISRGREFINKNKPAPGTYIQGAGVNPDLFTSGEKRDLCFEDIDKISTENPIILSRHCGHTIYANSLALKMAGFSENAPIVEGGTIVIDSTGKPTGVFKENANGLLRKPMPAFGQDELENHLRLGMKKAQSLGITSCGSYDSGGPDFDMVLDAYKNVLNEFRSTGKPGLRVTMQCGISLRDDMLDAHLERNNLLGTRDGLKPVWQDEKWGGFLKRGSIKIFADGTLGGQTAWMKKPYRDKEETSGFPLMEQSRLEHFISKADRAGMQVLVHAIGDAGIDSVITAFENITGRKDNPNRHGIIHCQITSMDLIDRIAAGNFLVLAQPAFLSDDIHILESRVGSELASTSYNWAAMKEKSISVSFGTDAPVSNLNPLFGIEWAIKRNVDIHSAFESYTSLAAHANHDEDSLGCIKPGLWADLVFLDRDIFSIPPGELTETNVLRTLCAGETVYHI